MKCSHCWDFIVQCNLFTNTPGDMWSLPLEFYTGTFLCYNYSHTQTWLKTKKKQWHYHGYSNPIALRDALKETRPKTWPILKDMAICSFKKSFTLHWVLLSLLYHEKYCTVARFRILLSILLPIQIFQAEIFSLTN